MQSLRVSLTRICGFSVSAACGAHLGPVLVVGRSEERCPNIVLPFNEAAVFYFRSQRTVGRLTRGFREAPGPRAGLPCVRAVGEVGTNPAGSGCPCVSVFRRRTTPGTVAVWRWRNWAGEACCSLLDSRTVSTAHVCSASSGPFVASWVLHVTLSPQRGLPRARPRPLPLLPAHLCAGERRRDLWLSPFLPVLTFLGF